MKKLMKHKFLIGIVLLLICSLSFVNAATATLRVEKGAATGNGYYWPNITEDVHSDILGYTPGWSGSGPYNPDTDRGHKIFLVNGKPKCVISADKNQIQVINYEDSTIETILPERHVFMGNTYFYGKIVSMFGSDLLKGKNGTSKIMKYMMLSEMMKGNSGNGSNGMGAMLPLMLMSGGTSDLFSGVFDFGEEESGTNSEESEEE